MSKKEVFHYAFIKSLPVMCSYLFLGIAYGILMEDAGFHWYTSLFASFIVYTAGMSEEERQCFREETGYRLWQDAAGLSYRTSRWSSYIQSILE